MQALSQLSYGPETGRSYLLLFASRIDDTAHVVVIIVRGNKGIIHIIGVVIVELGQININLVLRGFVILIRKIGIRFDDGDGVFLVNLILFLILHYGFLGRSTDLGNFLGGAHAFTLHGFRFKNGMTDGAFEWITIQIVKMGAAA